MMPKGLPTQREFVQNAREKSAFAAEQAAIALSQGKKREARQWNAHRKKFDKLVENYDLDRYSIEKET